MFSGCKIKDKGIMDQCARFVLENQVKDRVLWEKFTEVFDTREDSALGRWRGEYFGKQMRGAALIYTYTKDEELYDVLTDAVVSLLKRQDEYGRFSTYNVEEEFRGWDVWCRKYVLVGLLYYCDICKDEAFKEKILAACCKHLDYILSKVGKEDGKMAITDTSHWWGCVNSCTILEPAVELYKRTKKTEYLAFAEYIISTGGCKDCNLVELALADEIAPYQYPVTKAYEMMSFYEGLLAYYEVTGEVKYFNAVTRFIEAVAKTDITIIGCAGCTHELFDNSAVVQTEYQENIMQETCVTVTWMRVLARLYALTKDSKYIDRFEVAGYNALYGSLNTENNEQWNMEKGVYYPAMAFDSYSPLYMNTRGRGIGGCNDFASGGYYGCCLAIGACGVALMPLTAVMQDEDGVYINGYFQGVAYVRDNNGKDVVLHFESQYPANGEVKITVECEEVANLSLKLRKPAWCENMTVNGMVVDKEGYYLLTGEYQDGDSVEIVMGITLKMHRLNGKIAFTYGGLTLAADEWKAGEIMKKPISLAEPLQYRVLATEEGELVRISCILADGEITLADYQSCGKKWLSDKPLMTVWFDEK